MPSSLVLAPNTIHTWQIISKNASRRSWGPTWHFTIQPIAGDANLDGVVDTSDFTALAANFLKTAMNWMGGDFTGDGKVNALDFNVLATNFGQSAPAGASALEQTTAPARTSLAPSLFDAASSTPDQLAAQLFSSASVRDPLQ